MSAVTIHQGVAQVDEYARAERGRSATSNTQQTLREGLGLHVVVSHDLLADGIDHFFQPLSEQLRGEPGVANAGDSFVRTQRHRDEINLSMPCALGLCSRGIRTALV
jgi:hypothetical protein